MRFACLLLLLTTGLLAPMSSGAATEMEERAAIRNASRDAFLREDFSWLEHASRDYRSTKSRTPSGVWKLSVFHAGINEAIVARSKSQAPEAIFRELAGITSKWAKLHPDSPNAHIAHSVVLI